MSTICAIATSQGGAIGIVRVSGPLALGAVDKIFKGKTTLQQAKPYTVNYGYIYDGEQVLDEVLVSVFKAPNSYTGEDSVEIACHGSAYILQRILDLLLSDKCQMATPGEFTLRAFANGKMDLSQAEAVADLIAAGSKSAHQVAMRQMRGGISKKLNQLRTQLLEMASLLELELDFSEEDVEFADRSKLQSIAKEIKAEIERLANSFSAGNAIKNGIPVAIIGAPNVGKSTLLNALLKDNRAIVSDIQGTTRDIIEDTITIGGVVFRFIDTAGLRDTNDTIEKMGIERSLKALSKASIILLVAEPGVPYPVIKTRQDQTVIHILNKSDDFQALTGVGMEWLETKLLDAAPKLTGNDVLITNIRHKQALDLANISIGQALESIQSDIPTDIIAEDLRQCLTHLAEITGGQITSDQILQNIFQNFCIGK